MSKTVEINVPVKGYRRPDSKRKSAWTATRTGKVYIFPIGNRKVRFLRQDNGHLTHIASGNIAIRDNIVNAIKVSHKGRLSDREAYKHAVTALVDRYGAEHILRKMDEAKVIN